MRLHFLLFGNFAAAGSAFGGEMGDLVKDTKSGKKEKVADPTGWAKSEVLMERFVSLHRHAYTKRRGGARRVCLRLG